MQKDPKKVFIGGIVFGIFLSLVSTVGVQVYAQLVSEDELEYVPVVKLDSRVEALMASTTSLDLNTATSIVHSNDQHDSLILRLDQIISLLYVIAFPKN